MAVNLEYFRLFYHVARHQSITKAAEELSISRPAVSQELQKLEEQLGFALFSRRPRGVVLTAEGQRLLNQIGLAVQTLLEAERQAEAIKNLETGSVSVSFNGLTLQHTFQRLTAAFQQEHPNILIQSSVIHRHSLRSALNSGTVDMAFVRRPSDTPFPPRPNQPQDLTEYSLGTFEDVFFVHRRLEHMAKRKVHLRELAEYAFAFLRDQTLLGTEYYREHIESFPAARERDMQLDKMDAILNVLALGDYIGAAPSLSVYPYAANENFIQLDVYEQGFPVQYLLIFSKVRKPSLAATRLIDYLLNLEVFTPKEIECSV